MNIDMAVIGGDIPTYNISNKIEILLNKKSERYHAPAFNGTYNSDRGYSHYLYLVNAHSLESKLGNWLVTEEPSYLPDFNYNGQEGTNRIFENSIVETKILMTNPKKTLFSAETRYNSRYVSAKVEGARCTVLQRGSLTPFVEGCRRKDTISFIENPTVQYNPSFDFSITWEFGEGELAQPDVDTMAFRYVAVTQSFQLETFKRKR